MFIQTLDFVDKVTIDSLRAWCYLRLLPFVRGQQPLGLGILLMQFFKIDKKALYMKLVE